MKTHHQKLLLLLIAWLPCGIFAQMGALTVSPIWGSSTQNTLAAPISNDPNWGTLPSQQTQNSNTNNFGRNTNATPRRTYRDVYNNPILTDLQGNIIYDANGNPAIDSFALGQQSVSGTTSEDNSGIAPPPDDPVDVPIDSGVEILLIIGVGIGYRNSGKKGM